MSTALAEKPPDATPPANDPVYYDSDGKPISDNTKQFEWIVMLHSGFATLYRDDPNVFVAGDLLWYPVELLEHIPDIAGWKSPPTGVRFEVDNAGNLLCFRPDGTRFESYEALSRRADRLEARLRELGVEPPVD